jgi:transcription elongation factor
MRLRACLALCLFASPAFANDVVRIENLTVTAESAVTDEEFTDSLAALGARKNDGGGGNTPNWMSSGNTPNWYTKSNTPDWVTAGNTPNWLTAGNTPNWYTGNSSFEADGLSYPEPELGIAE